MLMNSTHSISMAVNGHASSHATNVQPANSRATLKRSASLDDHDHDDENDQQGGRQRSRAACAPCRQRKRKWYVHVLLLHSDS